ncbi:protein AKTIP homolog isoform X2 [Sycon ciliatum]|uniref:protein AKTIP homolog isoform X2 n=1 Tax=Sycon ciliatum TaxID=27933 RepID=UPI0020AB1D4E|eukprot:scpid37609/ scgid21572/ Protein AKTIP homolog; Fused toes protein homolog
MSSTSSSSSQSRKGDAATTASTQGKSTSSTATAAARSSGIRKPPPLKRLSDQTQARAKRQSATASAASSAAKSRATGSTASSSSATGTKAKVSTNVSQPTVTRRPGVAVRKVAEKPADVPSVSISGSSTAGHVTASSIAATVDTAAGLSPSVLEFKPYFQELDVLIEYKLVCHYMVREGVYVVPSLKSGRVWHGVICLHAGPFKGGVFRFNIFFPDRFPHEHPMIKFVSYVFHPQVDSNGILNITQAFPHWHAQRDHVWHVLQHMKKVFCSLDTWQPTNEKATIAVHESMDAYNAQAHTCVHQSIQDLLESTGSSDDDGNFLKYFEISDEANAEIKQQIGSQMITVDQALRIPLSPRRCPSLTPRGSTHIVSI